MLEENVNNCATCGFRDRSSRFQPCIECLQNGKPGNQFPNWVPEEDEQPCA